MYVLVVDDEPRALEIMQQVLSDIGHQAVPAANAGEALDKCAQMRFPVVITDVRMPGLDGVTLLRKIKREISWGRECDVILCTAHGDMDLAIEALREGAYDFLQKPVDARALAAVVERAAEHQALIRENKDLSFKFSKRVREETKTLRRDLLFARRNLRTALGIGEIVTASQTMEKIVAEAENYHLDPAIPVLIEGETGTGKEVIAKLIHFGTDVVHTPFVDLNCSAISGELFESELFGYEAGAFTGGNPDGARGKLELAGNGTLLLDEIGDMPLNLQPKLLRVLQERTFYKVGGLKKIEFRARIVCATNRDIEEMVELGKFRRDLFHRLNVGRIRIPPLRERKEAIMPLVRFFVTRTAERKKKRIDTIHPDVGALLQSHDWPGNIRELENAVERAVLTVTAHELKPKHFSFITPGSRERKSGPETASPVLGAANIVLPENKLDLKEFTDAVILKAIEKFNGNKTRAAEYLGMSRGALRNRLDQMDAEDGHAPA